MKNLFKASFMPIFGTMRSIAIISIVAVLGFSVVSCSGDGDNGGNGGGGPTNLPANLQNTEWRSSSGSTVIHFSTNTINTTGYFHSEVMTVFSAVENGKITAKAGTSEMWSGMEEVEICTSYSIDTSKTPNELTFVGGSHSWGQELPSMSPFKKE